MVYHLNPNPMGDQPKEVTINVTEKIEQYCSSQKFKDIVKKEYTNASFATSKKIKEDVTTDLKRDMQKIATDKVSACYATREFKNAVESVQLDFMRNESFVTNLLRQMHIASAINTEVRDKVASAVKSEIKSQLSPSLNKKLDSELASKVLPYIEKELNKIIHLRIETAARPIIQKIYDEQIGFFMTNQLPAMIHERLPVHYNEYVTTNPQLVGIWNTYIFQLTESLKSSVGVIMRDISTDPAHTAVINAHIESINSKYYEESVKLNQQSLAQLTSQRYTFETELADIKNANENYQRTNAEKFQQSFNTLSNSVNTELANICNLKNYVSQLEENIKNLNSTNAKQNYLLENRLTEAEKNTSYWKWGAAIFGTVSTIALIFLASKNHSLPSNAVSFKVI